MRSLTPANRGIARLRSAACPYRFRIESRTNKQPGKEGLVQTIRVYTTADSGARSKRVKGCSIDDEAHISALTELLLAAGEDLVAGGRGLDWTRLDKSLVKSDGSITFTEQTWGEVIQIVQDLVKPGGPKSRDKNNLRCFSGRLGYFPTHFNPNDIATTEELELYCFYELESLKAHKKDPKHKLVELDPGKGAFRSRFELVSALKKNGIKIATAELLERINGLKAKRKPPEAKFIPTEQDVEEWLDNLVKHDPLKAWAAAMLATYGLRNHELWHINALPGEDPANPSFIEIAEHTKTGVPRVAIPLPERWIWRYKLNDLEHSRSMLRALRAKHPVKTATCQLTGEQVAANNPDLGRQVTKWFNCPLRPQSEFAVPLFGWVTPKRPPGAETEPVPVRGRCTAYGLRHSWAIRAKQQQSWSCELKASSMGHSVQVHTSTYLSNETIDTRREWTARQKQLDEREKKQQDPLLQQTQPIGDERLELVMRENAKLKAALAAYLAG